jgi:hypothetical protein
MNGPKCNEYDYINFLVAAQRMMQHIPLDSAALWAEIEPCIDTRMGMLVLEDTTLDKSSTHF